MISSRFIAVALTVAISWGAACAVQPDNRQLAEELLGLMHVETDLDAVRAQLRAGVAAQVQAMNVPQTMKDKSARFQQRMIDLVLNELTLSKMKSAYIDIYASTFTSDELAPKESERKRGG